MSCVTYNNLHKVSTAKYFIVHRQLSKGEQKEGNNVKLCNERRTVCSVKGESLSAECVNVIFAQRADRADTVTRPRGPVRLSPPVKRQQ